MLTHVLHINELCFKKYKRSVFLEIKFVFLIGVGIFGNKIH